MADYGEIVENFPAKFLRLEVLIISLHNYGVLDPYIISDFDEEITFEAIFCSFIHVALNMYISWTKPCYIMWLRVSFCPLLRCRTFSFHARYEG